MHADIRTFNEELEEGDREICELLSSQIDEHLPEAQSKIWHRHPVWFLDGNPTVGYSRLKAGLRLMFWSGADFEEDALKPATVISRMRRSSISQFAKSDSKISGAG